MDYERFYFAHQFSGMVIGGYAIGARALVQQLRAHGTAFPRWPIVVLRSEGPIIDVHDDPLRGQAFFPAAVDPDSARDVERVRQQPGQVA